MTTVKSIPDNRLGREEKVLERARKAPRKPGDDIGRRKTRLQTMKDKPIVIGDKIRKKFGRHGWFIGTLISKDDDYWKVRYTDGDEEELYEKILEITGVGLRAILKGPILNLQLGFSHDISYKIPEGVKLTVEKSTIIKINGIDKELVGKVAAEIRMLKPAEPYKGKGIKERGQYILRKEGKKK